jgi:dipeptidyl-peptidase-4
VLVFSRRRSPRHAEKPVITPSPRLMRVGEHDLCAGVLLPRDHLAGDPLPVLMDPYGGPHAQRVVAMHDRWLESQWLADQGSRLWSPTAAAPARVVPAWDRSVHHELAAVTLDDQVEALQAVAKEVPELDLSRVAIRGWSYGGYLAALAVLRRPDVFHAAVAGHP